MKSFKSSKSTESNSGMSLFMIVMLTFSLLFLFISPNSFGQTSKTTGAMYPSIRYSYVKYGTNYSRSNDNKVGYEKVSNQIRHYTQGMDWNLDNIIPDNATITGCQLTFNSGTNLIGTTGDGTIKFTGIPWSFYDNTNFEAVYGLILNGPNRGTVAIGDYNPYSVSLPSWVTDIQEAIQSNYQTVGLGAFNSGVPQSCGTSFSNPSLVINYTVPTPPRPTN